MHVAELLNSARRTGPRQTLTKRSPRARVSVVAQHLSLESSNGLMDLCCIIRIIQTYQGAIECGATARRSYCDDEQRVCSAWASPPSDLFDAMSVTAGTSISGDIDRYRRPAQMPVIEVGGSHQLFAEHGRSGRREITLGGTETDKWVHTGGKRSVVVVANMTMDGVSMQLQKRTGKIRPRSLTAAQTAKLLAGTAKLHEGNTRGWLLGKPPTELTLWSAVGTVERPCLQQIGIPGVWDEQCGSFDEYLCGEITREITPTHASGATC